MARNESARCDGRRARTQSGGRLDSRRRSPLLFVLLRRPRRGTHLHQCGMLRARDCAAATRPKMISRVTSTFACFSRRSSLSPRLLRNDLTVLPDRAFSLEWHKPISGFPRKAGGTLLRPVRVKRPLADFGRRHSKPRVRGRATSCPSSLQPRLFRHDLAVLPDVNRCPVNACRSVRRAHGPTQRLSNFSREVPGPIQRLFPAHSSRRSHPCGT
jgi:hypothetical protein